MGLSETQVLIQQECDAVKILLLQKNERYGNSAAQPLGVMAVATPLTQIAVRCDDKLKRIQSMGGLEKVLTSQAPDAEDTVMDLIGYLVLARVVSKSLVSVVPVLNNT